MKSILTLFITLLLFGCAQKKNVVEKITSPTEMGETESRTLIIYCTAEADRSSLRKIIEAYGAEVKYEYRQINGFAITIPANMDISKAIEYFKKQKGVASVTRSRKLQLH